MNDEEINMFRMKAYLDFAEVDKVESLELPYETASYKNKKGNLMDCRILIRRNNGEIIVENLNGCRICLTEKDLIL